jgi:hypothetical protein
MKITIILLNLSSNIQIKDELKKYYPSNTINEYHDIESYNKHLNSYHNDNYEEYYFDEYKNNFELIFIVTECSKSKIRKNISKYKYIPISIININPKKDLKQQLTSKIEQKKIHLDSLWFYNEFISIYRSLLRQKKINFDNFLDHIKQCPFCKNNKFIFTHDYSEENTSRCNLFLKCKSCDITLEYEGFIQIFDASYVYSPEIKISLDEYIKVYPFQESIKSNIWEEYKKTECTLAICL